LSLCFEADGFPPPGVDGVAQLRRGFERQHTARRDLDRHRGLGVATEPRGFGANLEPAETTDAQAAIRDERSADFLDEIVHQLFSIHARERSACAIGDVGQIGAGEISACHERTSEKTATQ